MLALAKRWISKRIPTDLNPNHERQICECAAVCLPFACGGLHTASLCLLLLLTRANARRDFGRDSRVGEIPGGPRTFQASKIPLWNTKSRVGGWLFWWFRWPLAGARSQSMRHSLSWTLCVRAPDKPPARFNADPLHQQTSNHGPTRSTSLRKKP